MRWAFAMVGTIGLVAAMAATGALARPMAYEGPRVAFESYRDGNAEIYVVPVDGSSAPVNVTRAPGANDRHPSWSRDIDGNTCPQNPPEPPTTQLLAFDSDRDGGDADIFVTNGLAAPPAAVTNLTGDDPANDSAPAWSPAGLIAYTSDKGGDREIWVMSSDGSNKAQVTDNAADDANPDWSPVSQQLAFESDRSGVRQIYVVDLTPTAGSGPPTPGPVHQVTFGGGAKYDPTWANYADSHGVSLQGPHDIAYSVEQGGKRYLDVAEVGSVDGPAVTDPFHEPGAIRTFPLTGDPGGDTAPNWSPIGLNVVYASTAGGANEDLYGLGERFAPASSNPWQGPAMRLTTDPARDTNPDWEPSEQCSVMVPRPPIPAPTRTANDAAKGGGPGGNGNSGDRGGGLGGGGGQRPGCTIQGGPSNDVLRGTRGRDVICGGGGDDRIIGGRGDDVIDGGPGNDRILGGSGDDRLIGGRGRDRISGGRGKDSIAAKDGGRDVVSGGLGSDVARLDKKRDRVRSVERKLW